MRGLSLPAVPRAIKPPTVKIKAATIPKIRAVHIEKVSNGLKVTHEMSGTARNKQFVFASPAKALVHLRRIERNAWLRPMANPAPPIAHSLDIGETP